MTNLQRAAVKAYMISLHELNSAKWNGNQLVGKGPKDRKWRVLIADESEAEVAFKQAKKELVR